MKNGGQGLPPARLDELGREPLFRDDGARDGPSWARWLLGLVLLGAGGALARMVLLAPRRPPVLPMLVAQDLEGTGVSHPVTAVLLGFRAYDTFLEVVVLTVAMVAVWSLDRGTRAFAREPGERRRDPVLRALARLVVPLAALTTVHLTWVGSRAPGGAFPAAALLAGAGVLLVAGGLLRPPTAGSRVVRGVVAAGLYTFALVGLVGVPWTGAFLGVPPEWSYVLILTLEAVLTVSVAVTLLELFVDVPAVPDPNLALERLHPTGDPLGRVLDVESGPLTGGTP